MVSDSLKRTPLYEIHQRYGGKMIDFGGWELPVQYASIIQEHHMVREKAGIFDVSHMGEIEVTGEKAEGFVRYLMTNDVTRLKDKQVQYTLMCYPDGGVVDDLLVYRFSQQHYLLVVNASNTEKDYQWILSHAPEGIQVANVSDQYAQIAVQGPKAQEILQKISDTDLSQIRFFWFEPQVKLAGIQCMVSRTGYTGEDGFEIYLPAAEAAELWERIMEAGGEDIGPAGLGARDTLRFEAKLPLYGQELGPDITPLEAVLGHFVKLDSGDFIGRDALLKQRDEGIKHSLAEFEMIGRGIPRSHYEVYKNGEKIGYVTSGAYAPTLGKPMGLALIESRWSEPGEDIDIMIRYKLIPARVTRGAFYKRPQK
ncbi:MAG: glycine cleavage system aminomethyltransferase GcvT [Syntrophomonadaceae bacterium]|nr:glycine cleavage system aminomethyltransferase GcvT [Syntrophomonadaceae bacterium]